ncbi:uncharacterized protein AB675_6743 [Cyphellophora attinorum]|uniref:Uncharacterized protein n=1 Tax=Cyphellophora attinorum TaxID=1664694 RepID=A0A0N1HYB8_9EURO|nr:uncharacterized protein AB675_6743 [Phialophora attinorum]KPI43345.1 hypothetical protein AB675_6743 [Phialophora attinorum]
MMRCLIEYLEEEKGDDGLLITDRHEANRQALARLEEQWPIETSGKITTVHIERQFENIARRWHYGPTISGGMSSLRKYLFRHGKSAIDYRLARAGVFSRDEIASWESEKKAERKAARAKSTNPTKRRNLADELNWEYPSRKHQRAASIPDSDSTNQDAIANSVESRNLVTPSGHGSGVLVSLQHFLTNPPNPTTLKPEFIASEMSFISHSINATVFRRLQAADINTNGPVILSFDQLDHDFTKLLEKVLGFQRSEFDSGRERLNELRAEKYLPLEHFVRSLVGAALTTWVFRRDPGAEESNKTLEIYRQVVGKMDTNLAMHVDAIAREVYLTQEVVPTIKQRAKDFAERLDNVVFRFIEPPSSDTRHRDGEGFDSKHSIPTYGEDSDDSEDEITVLEQRVAHAPSVSPITPPRRSRRSEGAPGRDDVQPHFTTEWKASLARIFERAFNLRIKMEQKASQATYTFEFPYPGQIYDESNREGHIGAIRKQRRVMIGILPAVYYVTKDQDGREVDRIACAPHKSFDC